MVVTSLPVASSRLRPVVCQSQGAPAWTSWIFPLWPRGPPYQARRISTPPGGDQRWASSAVAEFPPLAAASISAHREKSPDRWWFASSSGVRRPSPLEKGLAPSSRSAATVSALPRCAASCKGVREA